MISIHSRMLATLALLTAPLTFNAKAALDMTCGGCATFISAIQGQGGPSPLIPRGKKESPEIVVEAVVTANTPNRLKGFFIQEEMFDEDGRPDTSEGLFVSGIQEQLQPGHKVRIRGTVKEAYGQTIMELKELKTCSIDALDEVRPAIPNRNTSLQQLEHLEGMQVRFTGDNALTVSRNYSFNFTSYRSNMDVSFGGPLYKPTQVYPPLSPSAIALAERNDQNRLTLITDESRQIKGKIPYYSAFGPYIHYIRVGDTISDLTGVVTYRYGRYEIIPTQPLDTYAFQHSFSPRSAYPKPHTHGTVRVASFNVLNYFNTLMPDHKANPTGTNRGAKTREEFELQRQKIVEAVTRIDADIIGLVEIENNGFGPGSAMDDLLETINSRLPATEHYKAVETFDQSPVGSDAITTGLVYKPGRVSPHGALQVITMPVQNFTLTSTVDKKVEITKRMRPSLLQSFRDHSSGQNMTIAVSHFKSKGSMCYEDYMEYADKDGKIPLKGTRIIKGSPRTSPEPDDLQGSCNEFRVSAARILGRHLQANQLQVNHSQPADYVLLIGDFNAYGQEDPVRLLSSPNKLHQAVQTSSHTTINCHSFPQETLDRGFGLVNLEARSGGKHSYSFIFDGELGALDHAITNKALASKVVRVQNWHINSPENSLFEYPGKYSGDLPKDPGPFSASDHDPLLVDLDFSH